MTVLILSPHCDDVPYSMGASLLARALGPDVEVHVVFSISCYAYQSLLPSEIQSTTALRQTEERCAALAAGYHVTFWELPEAPLRPEFSGMRSLFSRERDPRRDSIWSSVRRALDDRLTRARWDIVFIPLGCGNHIDHRIVREAALDRFSPAWDTQALAFYEELPYAGWLPPERIDARIESVPGVIRPLLRGDEFLQAKQALLRCYPSQVRQPEMDAVAGYATRLGGERLWLNEAARLPGADERGIV